jgi:hypothetical protein
MTQKAFEGKSALPRRPLHDQMAQRWWANLQGARPWSPLPNVCMIVHINKERYMDIGFVWDEEKYQQVVVDHQVRFYEVVSAFEDRNGYESRLQQGIQTDGYGSGKRCTNGCLL